MMTLSWKNVFSRECVGGSCGGEITEYFLDSRSTSSVIGSLNCYIQLKNEITYRNVFSESSNSFFNNRANLQYSMLESS